MPLLYSEGVCTVYSRGSPCGYPGPCGCLPLFPSSGITRFIRQRYKIWDESCLLCLTPGYSNNFLQLRYLSATLAYGACAHLYYYCLALEHPFLPPLDNCLSAYL